MTKTIQFKNSSALFDMETGEFTWIICYRKPWMNGRPAARKTPNGYLYIRADKKHHSASRLAWQLYHNQPIPEEMEIDHINRIKTDNRKENLRVVTRKENLANKDNRPISETGHLGVSKHWRPSGNGFLYRARHRNKTTYHETLDEAIAGYAKLGSEACDK